MRTRDLLSGLVLGGLGVAIWRYSKSHRITGRLFIVKKAIQPTPAPILPETEAPEVEEDVNGYPETWMSAQDLYLTRTCVNDLPQGGNLGINSLDRGDKMSQGEYQKVTEAAKKDPGKTLRHQLRGW